MKKNMGYAADPGTGPVGRTCAECCSYRRPLEFGKVKRGCALARRPGLRIKAGAPACSKFVEGKQ